MRQQQRRPDYWWCNAMRKLDSRTSRWVQYVEKVCPFAFGRVRRSFPLLHGPGEWLWGVTSPESNRKWREWVL